MKTLEYKNTIEINKPVEIVFNYLSTHENHKYIFKANIDCRQITEGPMGVGTKVSNIASFLGNRMEEHFEIVTFEKNRKIAKKTLPGSTHPNEDCFIFTALDEDRTQLELHIIGWPKGILKHLLFIVRPLFKKAVNKDLKNLKKLVETL